MTCYERDETIGETMMCFGIDLANSIWMPFPRPFLAANSFLIEDGLGNGLCIQRGFGNKSSEDTLRFHSLAGETLRRRF